MQLEDTTDTYMYIHTYMYILVLIRINAGIYVYMPVCIFTHVLSIDVMGLGRADRFIHTSICIYTCGLTLVYLHIRTCTYTCTNIFTSI